MLNTDWLHGLEHCHKITTVHHAIEEGIEPFGGLLLSSALKGNLPLWVIIKMQSLCKLG